MRAPWPVRFDSVESHNSGFEWREQGAPVLRIGRMSVPAEVEAEWNGWYNDDCIAGYRKVPDVIYARCYRVHEASRYLYHRLRVHRSAVLESAEWTEQNLHSSPAPHARGRR